MKRIIVAVFLLAGLVVPLSSVQAAGVTTCSGGTIAAGNYSTLIVNGNCALPSTGTVNVAGNLIVAAGATFNGLTLATLNVGGNMQVGKGAIAVLGCSPEAGCSGVSSDRINGNLTADQALAVIVHSSTIGGNVSIHGGGGGVNCDVNATLAHIVGFPAPLFTDVEDSRIGGNLVVTDVHSCFFATIRNHVGGNEIASNNTFADPDATEIVTNTITGNLVCTGNSPTAQVGDSGGSPNVVGGHKLGECAKL